MYQNRKIVKKIYDNSTRPFQNLMFSVHGLIKKYQRKRINKVVQRLEKSQFFVESEIKKNQIKKLRILLKHAYEKVPYYTKLFDERGIKPSYIKSLQDFNKIPILTKDLIMINKPALVASNKSFFRPLKLNTGGTTGTSLDFLMDLNCYYLREAEMLRYFRWHGYDVDTDRTLVIRGNVLIPAGKNIERPWRYDYFRNTLYFSSYYLNDEVMYSYYNLAKDWKPSFIRAYPSAIITFAKFLNSKGLKIKIKKIFTSSENLPELYLDEIREAFECEIIDHYGHGEPGCYVAGQCKDSLYRVPVENVYVEVNNDGEIIETSLNNFSMPFIRYKIGDIVDGLHYDSNLKIKLPYFKRIHGRDDEFIITPSGRKIGRLDQIVKGTRVKRSQIIQKKIDEIIVLVIPLPGFSSEDEILIKTHLLERLGEGINFFIRPVQKIDLEKSGKFRFVKSLIQNSEVKHQK